MKSITTLKTELNTLKANVIGLCKIQDKFELVVDYKDTNKTVDTIRITQFGAIQQNYGIPMAYGKFILFPDNKNMNDMLSNPFEWSDFIESFNSIQ